MGSQSSRTLHVWITDYLDRFFFPSQMIILFSFYVSLVIKYVKKMSHFDENMLVLCHFWCPTP